MTTGINQAEFNQRCTQIGYNNTEITRMTPLVRSLCWLAIVVENGFVSQAAAEYRIASAAEMQATAIRDGALNGS